MGLIQSALKSIESSGWLPFKNKTRRTLQPNGVESTQKVKY